MAAGVYQQLLVVERKILTTIVVCLQLLVSESSSWRLAGCRKRFRCRETRSKIVPVSTPTSADCKPGHTPVTLHLKCSDGLRR